MRTKILSTAAVVALAIGCGSTPPPKELVDARAAYMKAAEGPAKETAPAQLHEAKNALDGANQAFADDADSPDTKDKSYLAMRKAEQAEAYARYKQAQAEREDAQKKAGIYTAESLSKTRQELEKTKDQLEKEKLAREAAEKRAAQALSDLQKIANAKQEARGIVITLSGGVLFASNQSTLLPAAMVKLNEVADALVKNNPDSKMTVEGHTDSQGKADYNRDLSQKRAESVREYLISRGIASDRIKAHGYGSERPIADNNNAEGRANNRRVEIVVEPGK
jgi:outer membrane protein OmpA-like peptidoglycan-associated protein